MERLEHDSMLQNMVAFISDGCSMNSFAMGRWTVPRLWDISHMLRWFPETHGVRNRTMERAYEVHFKRWSYPRTFVAIRRRLRAEVDGMNARFRRADDSMEAAVLKFFRH